MCGMLKPSFIPPAFLEACLANEAKIPTASQALNLLKQQGFIIKDNIAPVI